VLSRAALEVPDDAADGTQAAADNHVHMLRKDRAGVDPVAALPDSLGESLADSQGLPTAESHGLVLQRFFRLFSQASVMVRGRNRPSRADLRGVAESDEFPGADEVRP
jgi:hypothetical protein